MTTGCSSRGSDRSRIQSVSTMPNRTPAACLRLVIVSRRRRSRKVAFIPAYTSFRYGGILTSAILFCNMIEQKSNCIV